MLIDIFASSGFFYTLRSSVYKEWSVLKTFSQAKILSWMMFINFFLIKFVNFIENPPLDKTLPRTSNIKYGWKLVLML